MRIISEATKQQEAVISYERKNIVRRLYDWVLHWAETPYGAWALFLLAFAESSFFPVPPDVLLIALAIAVKEKAFKFALICSVASLLGGILGYIIGFGFWNITSDYFFTYVPGFSQEAFETVRELYKQWDFLIVFTAGFTFIPYKIFTISSGAFGINFWGFIIASAIGRSARFFLVGWLIWKFGAPIKGFIDKYFNLLAMLFVALLILGFVLIKYVFKF
jgi:membrane protein YqaA with SNARE-associated domain